MDNLTKVITRQTFEVYQKLKKKKIYHPKKGKIFKKFATDDIGEHYFEVSNWLNQKLGVNKNKFFI